MPITRTKDGRTFVRTPAGQRQRVKQLRARANRAIARAETLAESLLDTDALLMDGVLTKARKAVDRAESLVDEYLIEHAVSSSQDPPNRRPSAAVARGEFSRERPSLSEGSPQEAG